MAELHVRWPECLEHELGAANVVVTAFKRDDTTNPLTAGQLKGVVSFVGSQFQDGLHAPEAKAQSKKRSTLLVSRGTASPEGVAIRLECEPPGIERANALSKFESLGSKAIETLTTG